MSSRGTGAPALRASLRNCVGACGRTPVSVTRFTCVAVSYPDFLADLKGLVK